VEASQDIPRKLETYRQKAIQLIENADGLVRKGELEKAGEFYWGALTCYLNSLELLRTGKSHSKHGEMVREAKQIASNRSDPALFNALQSAEKLHANYYHSILSEDEFPDYYEKWKYAFQGFEKILKEELSRWFQPPPDG
jgi:hypothetical protein